MTMPFGPIPAAARARRGPGIEARLPQPRSAAEPRAQGDDRPLPQMSLRIFRAGLRHSLVDAKWPAFEEVFHFWGPRATSNVLNTLFSVAPGPMALTVIRRCAGAAAK